MWVTDVILAHISVQPVVEIEIFVIHRDQDRAHYTGQRNGPVGMQRPDPGCTPGCAAAITKHPVSIARARSNTCQCASPVGRAKADGTANTWAPACARALSWTITACNGTELAAGEAPYEGCVELGEDYVLNLQDSFGDGWDGTEMIIEDNAYTLTDGYEQSFEIGSCGIEGDPSLNPPLTISFLTLRFSTI